MRPQSVFIRCSTRRVFEVGKGSLMVVLSDFEESGRANRGVATFGLTTAMAG